MDDEKIWPSIIEYYCEGYVINQGDLFPIVIVEKLEHMIARYIRELHTELKASDTKTKPKKGIRL